MFVDFRIVELILVEGLSLKVAHPRRSLATRQTSAVTGDGAHESLDNRKR